MMFQNNGQRSQPVGSHCRNVAFMKTISSYFKDHPELGRIKTIVLMSPWGHGDRYRVKCTLQREYIVYEKDGESHNIGTYIKELE